MFPAAETARGFVGVAMLETRFPRWPGDIGHPDAFGRPVRQRVVAGAAPRRVVTSARALRESGLEADFHAVLQGLQDEGAAVLTTSCGFLVLLQDALQARLAVPLVTSSLLWLPQVLREEGTAGVLTISAGNLSADHLRAAGVDDARLADVHIEGVDPAGEFARAILGNEPAMDRARACRDVVDAARALVERAPQVRTLVLECTNMPPHAAEVVAATGRRVLSLRDWPALAGRG